MSNAKVYQLQSPPSLNGSSSISSKIVAEFGVSMADGFQKTVPGKPLYVDKRVPFRVVNVEEIREDPMHFHFSGAPSEPTFLAVPPSDASMLAVDVVSDRNCLRQLLNVVCSGPPGEAFYCKKKDFFILVEKIGNKLLMQRHNTEGEATWDPVPGGYGEGFERALIKSSVFTADIADMSFYRIASFTLCDLRFLVRHEVDCVHPSTDASIELKSKKVKINKKTNSFFPLNQDFYHHLWGQMVISDTKCAKIGMHQDGNVSVLQSLSKDQVAQNAGISPAYSDHNLRKLANILHWIRGNTLNGQQGLISYKEGESVLRLTILTGDGQFPCISDETRRMLGNTV